MKGVRAVSRWKLVSAIGIGVGLLYPSLSFAQTPPPISTTVPKATLADWEKGPHTGPVETALVGLEIYGRHGNGFVLRCDGFLVVPIDLFDLAGSETVPNVTITFYPGTNHEQKLVMPRRSRYFIDHQRPKGFTVFRVDGAVHLQALRTMLPDCVKPGPDGDTVEVVWSPWDAAARRYGPIQKRRVALAPLPPSETEEQKAALAEETKRRPGFVRFAQPQEGLPAGAVVLGPEGLAIGIVPGGGSGGVRDGFVSFSILNDITNCMTPVPVPDGRFTVRQTPQKTEEEGEGAEGEKKAAAPKTLAFADEMVSVPGGPVIVPRLMLAEQLDMEREPIACVAPFQIDKYEVTNRQYKAFWDSTQQRLTEKERKDRDLMLQLNQALFPLGWAPEGEPFPDEIANLPVIGVPLSGAKAYAKWAGKRLPTPYEWARAAFGPKGDSQTPEWVQRYILARQAAWRELVTEHIDYLKQNPGVLQKQAQLREKRGFRSTGGLKTFADEFPWFNADTENGQPVFSAEVRFSKGVTTRIADRMMEEWKDPIFMLGVGSRDYDVSPYGAMDMLLNANEMYMPNPQGPVFGAMRYVNMNWLGAGRGANDGVAPIWIFAALIPSEFSGPIASPEDQRRFSRIYKRLVRQRYQGFPRQPVPIEIAVVYSNIDDIMNLTYPLIGWYLKVNKQYEATSAMHPRTELMPDGSLKWEALAEAGLWLEPTLRYPHVETGWPDPRKGTLLMLPQKGDPDPMYPANSPIFSVSGAARDFFYVLPVGFRCVR